jgi:HPr kinase/phosphorylase
MTMNIHACCVVWGKAGLIIRGASGVGKSDLVLRLLVEHGATLVADDQVLLHVLGGAIVASAPVNLAGLVEVRGQGIVRFPHKAKTKIHAIIDLVPLAEIERLPEKSELETTLLGINLPYLKLWGEAASAPARIALFLKRGDVKSFSLGRKKR